jgi:metallo-beta-lactamase family protein
MTTKEENKIADSKIKNKVKITFAGGATTPTGSNFLLEYANKKFLVDCGLYQGSRIAEHENREDFSYDPKTIDALFITHGHLDHVGRIGKLVKDGFDGPIYSTPPTRDIGELIMLDSMSILAKEAKYDGLDPMYDENDVMHAMRNWNVKKYHESMSFNTSEGNVSVSFLDAGHIMGSSMIQFDIEGKKFLFTGDLGNTPSPLLKDTEVIKGIDYLIMESVYGDRNHELIEDRVKKLKEIVKRTLNVNGTLMIPAFSIERTQEILFQINNMVESGEIPRTKIYLDSPLGIKVTKVYKKYEREYMNKEVNQVIKEGDDIFNFPGLVMTENKEDSMKINADHGAKIIIAGSGMSNGGRIVHHEARYLPDPKATLLLVGYQALGTLGRHIQEGEKIVKIKGQEINVKCRVDMIGGFSAHKDSDGLVKFVESSADTLKKVFVVLGEPKSAMHLGQKLYEYYGLDVKIPTLGEVVEIEL